METERQTDKKIRGRIRVTSHLINHMNSLLMPCKAIGKCPTI